MKRIRDAFTRPPLPTPAPAAAAVADTHARKSLIAIGHKDSAILLTQLEMLRNAVLNQPETIRGIIIGLPFDRVERTLAGAGFNTAEDLFSLNTPRRTLRFEDPETATTWHLNESEFDRSGAKTEFSAGKRVPIAPELIFNDWTPSGRGMMRGRNTGREVKRPTELVFRQVFFTAANGGYDGIHDDISPDELMDRLRHFGALGLNAFLFVKNLVSLIQLTRNNFDGALLCDLITINELRQQEIEYLTAITDTLPEEARPGASDIIENLMQVSDNVPPMATDLATDLKAQIYHQRTLHPLDHFLVPGKIWHIATSKPVDKYIAHCLKSDLQRHLLRHKPGVDTTLIFISELTDFLAPGLDAACLERPDIMQCYGVTRSDILLEKHTEAVVPLFRAFPRHAWHITDRTTDADLLEKTYPFVPHARQQLAFLSWENRLHETEGRIKETPVNLNVDGREIQERARQSKVKRSIERGGFAQD